MLWWIVHWASQKHHYIDRCTLSTSRAAYDDVTSNKEPQRQFCEHVMSLCKRRHVMINTFTLPLFTIVWAFQLLFSYCPISSPDHLLSPSCRALIACSKANWAESASWQFIRRHLPEKKLDSNLKTCTRAAIPEWRPSGCESWQQKNLDPHKHQEHPHTTTKEKYWGPKKGWFHPIC